MPIDDMINILYVSIILDKFYVSTVYASKLVYVYERHQCNLHLVIS